MGFFVLFLPRPLTINSVFQAPYLSQLASVLPNIQNSPPIETALLNFSIAVLTAGDMSIAMSAGHFFITEALKTPKFGASLLGGPAELSWGEWKLAALLALFRSTGDLLTIEPKQMLCLCASLCHSDKLGEVDIMWRHTINLWLCERLSRWELNADSVDELRNLLSLSMYVEKILELLVGITQCMLDVFDPQRPFGMRPMSMQPGLYGHVCTPLWGRRMHRGDNRSIWWGGLGRWCNSGRGLSVP